jgi:hypothetical protein
MRIVKSSFIHSRAFQAVVHVWACMGMSGPTRADPGMAIKARFMLLFLAVPGWQKENVFTDSRCGGSLFEMAFLNLGFEMAL